MKAKEMIKALQDCDPESTFVFVDGFGEVHTIRDIMEEDDEIYLSMTPKED